MASSLRVTGAGFFPMLTEVEIVVTGSSSLGPTRAGDRIDAAHVTGARPPWARRGRRAGIHRHAGRIGTMTSGSPPSSPAEAGARADEREAEVRQSLRAVIDPELGDTIVDLGMVRGVTVVR